jgi:hypothetical protein
LSIVVLITAIYFTADYLCFGWFKMTPPDQGVPWAITLLICLGVSYWMTVAHRPPGDCVGDSRQERSSAEYRTLPPGGQQPTFLGTWEFPQVLSILVIIAAIYFSATYLCFGWFKMTPPDQCVPWAITLLICLGVSYCFTRRHGDTEEQTQRQASSVPLCLCVKKNASILLYIALAFYAPLTALPHYADLRTHSGRCRTEMEGPTGKKVGVEWQDMCHWIKENTEPTAKFWIPRDGQTFKWYAQRADIGTWKNVPQDAESVVKWYQSLEELYKYKDAEGKVAVDRLLTTLLNSKTEDEIAALQRKYGFTYILCAQSYEMPKHTTLEIVYENDVYCRYRVVR